MKDQDDAQAITAALWRTMLNRGPGTIKRTEKAIGVATDGLRAAKNSEHGLRLRHVTEAVKALGIPASVFFNEALDGGVATTAVDRFIARGAELAARKLVEFPELAESIKPDRLTNVDLARLDTARFEDPRAAAKQAAGIARQAARDGRRGDAAAAIARQGSALRVAEEWEPAWVCVWWAFRHAPDKPLIQADILLRCGAVLFEVGQFGDSAEIARTAAITFFEQGARKRAARALVNHGVALVNDDRFVDAVATFEAALSFLPDTDFANRVAVAQNLGLTFVALGDFDMADRQADVAESLPEIPGAFVPHLVWLRAKIAAGRERHLQAIRLYREAIVLLRESPGHAALAGTELCHVYLLAGETMPAIAEAKRLASYTMPSRQNPTVATAILDLYRSAQAGILTVQLVRQSISSIQNALKRRATF